MKRYAFADSAEELERLQFQAQVLQPFTVRLLDGMGVCSGMRVLDLGCGAGDVALMVAERVGPEGTVLGLDRSEKAVLLAARRARMAGLKQVAFEHCDVMAYDCRLPFDCVIGRYVLVHQHDPVAFLRKAASFVSPGGTLGLHEILLLDPLVQSQPPIALWNSAGDWIVAAIRAVAPHHDAAARLVKYFAEAGLQPATMLCERPIGGGEDSPLYRWAYEGVRGVWPYVLQQGLASEHDLRTFLNRLRKAVVESRAQLIGPTQIVAWTRIQQ